MVIQNYTELHFTLEVRLTFDDSTTKVAFVNDGDYLLLYFRYNGSKIMRPCKVVKLLPVELDTDPVSWGCSLLIDCSTKFSSNRLKVSSKDILNIRVVDKDLINSLAPDYIVTEPMFRDDTILPAVPEEIYMIPGVGIAGVDKARYIR